MTPVRGGGPMAIPGSKWGLLEITSPFFSFLHFPEETECAGDIGRNTNWNVFLSVHLPLLVCHPLPPSPISCEIFTEVSNCLYSNWIIFSYILRWQNSSCSSEMLKRPRTGPSSENVCISRTRDHVHPFLPLFLKSSFTSIDWITSWTDPEGPTRTHW